jgi:hypothetical protein
MQQPQGPPRLTAAMTGAKATSNTLPLGMRTASDEPTSVRATQKTKPSTISLWAWLPGVIEIGHPKGHNKTALTSSNPLTNATAAINAPSRRFIATPRSGAAIYPDPEPDGYGRDVPRTACTKRHLRRRPRGQLRGRRGWIQGDGAFRLPRSVVLFWRPRSVVLFWRPRSVVLFWRPRSVVLFWRPRSVVLFWRPRSVVLRPRPVVLLGGHGSPLLTRRRRAAGCTNCLVPAQVPEFGRDLETS